MNKLILITLITFGILSCSGQKQTSNSYLKKDEKLTIISSKENIKWATNKDYNQWSPSVIELLQIDSTLQTALDDGRFPFLKEPKLHVLKERYRQYVCFINEKNEKVVFINSFCRIPNVNRNGKMVPLKWKNEMIDVSDGGDCYWNIKINLSEKKYYDLKINGES